MDKKWCILGMPDDTGVSNVQGRTGASKGPEAFRKLFQKLKGRTLVHDSLTDLGDVEMTGDIVENHRRVTEMVAKLQSTYDFSVVVGGGHDLVFPHLKGVSEASGSRAVAGCINIDVHYDLRKDVPVITSGSPFYMAIDQNLLEPRNLVEFGIQEYSNAQELHDYAEEKGVTVVRFGELRNGKAVERFKTALDELSRRTDFIVLSLDLDALQFAYAPGVSAPAAEGFNPSEIMEMIIIAAQNPKVVSLGVYELSPEYDIAEMTARIAATVAYNFAAAKLGF